MQSISYMRGCVISPWRILIYVFLEQRKDFFLYFRRNEDGSKLGTEIGGLLKYEVRCQKWYRKVWLVYCCRRTVHCLTKNSQLSSYLTVSCPYGIVKPAIRDRRTRPSPGIPDSENWINNGFMKYSSLFTHPSPNALFIGICEGWVKSIP